MTSKSEPIRNQCGKKIGVCARLWIKKQNRLTL